MGELELQRVQAQHGQSPVGERNQPLAVVGVLLEREADGTGQVPEHRHAVAADPAHALGPDPVPLPEPQGQPEQRGAPPGARPSASRPCQGVRRRQTRLPPDRHEGVQQGHPRPGRRRRDDVPVHLAVDQGQVRPLVAQGTGERADAQRRRERAHAGGGRRRSCGAGAWPHPPPGTARNGSVRGNGTPGRDARRVRGHPGRRRT